MTVEPMIASTVTAWVVPALMFAVVIVAGLLGLRWIRNEHLEALRAVPLFSLLSDRELRSVLGATHQVGFQPGSEIVKEGDKGKGFFVIKSGTASVSVNGSEVATLGAGSYFGEMALLDGAPRAASIRATGRVDTLEIATGSFLHLLDREPMIARSLYLELNNRLKAVGQTVDEPEPARIDRETLIAQCQRLRNAVHADWAQVPPSHRRLRLTSLFARGS
jgi:signal-transduction protein with cAMP-binding, CBS, and nucleotidyltransferase domain